MSEPDPELDAFVNAMFARLSVLERLVAEYVAADWSPERVAVWSDRVTRQNDAAETTSPIGQADFQVAFDNLARRLLAASRHAHGR